MAASPERASRVADMHLAGRELSAAVIMFHSVVADRRGLSVVEEKALDILLRDGPLTHAELVARLGLAPASVSDLIDRLTRKGFAERRPHPDDGRRILVVADEQRAYAAMAPLFADFVSELERLYGDYSDSELDLIAGFLHAAAARQDAAARRLSDDA